MKKRRGISIDSGYSNRATLRRYKKKMEKTIILQAKWLGLDPKSKEGRELVWTMIKNYKEKNK